MKVLCVLDSFSFGGAENLVVEMARHAGRRFDVQAASLAPASQGRNAMLGRLIDAGLAPYHLDVDRLIDPAGFARLVRAMRETDADVIHAHLGYAATLVPLAARIAGKPCVATLHHLPEDLPRGEALKERLSVRIPAANGRLVLVSTPAYDETARRHGPAGPTWRMIHNGVDLDRFAPGDPATRAGRRAALLPEVPADAQVWATVAALREPKGHLDLLHAWTRITANHPHAHLVIVGDGPFRGAIEEEIAALGLGATVHLLGRREDVPELLRVVDGVVSASHTEALPTALIEAAAAELPVVATDAGGTRDIVICGVTGRIVPVRDVDALAAALDEVIGDPALGRRRGRAAREYAAAEFGMDVWLDRLDDLYREVFPAHAGRTAPVSTVSTTGTSAAAGTHPEENR